MSILLKSIPAKVYDLLLDKQLEFKKEKKHCVSLEQTVLKLLVNAYLIPKKGKEIKLDG